MKCLSTAVALAALACLSTAEAFIPERHAKSATSTGTSLSAVSRRESFSKAAALIGGAVAHPAFAEERLDFSLPSYDSSIKGTGGFGDGAEAVLNMEGRKSGTLSDPGSGEAEKQREAMRKAEEARKAKLAGKKAEMKAREEEDKRRALEKKEERARRMKGIFD